jgi:hypothetical protein
MDDGFICGRRPPTPLWLVTWRRQFMDVYITRSFYGLYVDYDHVVRYLYYVSLVWELEIEIPFGLFTVKRPGVSVEWAGF